MTRSQRCACLTVLGGALILVACQSVSEISGALSSGRVASVPNIHFRGAHPSSAWINYGGVRRLITFPTQIHHVVVIVMENRTVDDLFAAYYDSAFCGPSHSANCGTAMNLYNPGATPTLQPNSLSAHFDPDHGHAIGWWHESRGHWDTEPMSCAGLENGSCPSTDTPLSYAPAKETGIYKQLLENWAFANNVLQANEGPSFVAHQYFIAAQSGGLPAATSSPYAEAENPRPVSMSPSPTGDYAESDSAIDMVATAGCNPTSGYAVKTVNMAIPLPSSTPWDNGPTLAPPCEEYKTILDEVGQKTPPIAAWQYIAHADNTIWAAPLGVNHLYQRWLQGQNMFTVDPDAEQFVSDIGSSNPSRPFASLTYITPCAHESDHPADSGSDDGPEWLGWVLNAIGHSNYWNSTAIIVVWDDWGGFFDHVPPTGLGNIVHPNPNMYGTYPDPNEWGFRVPLFVISPYVTARGYVSSYGGNVPQYRSQSVILQFIEAIFGVNSLGGDDYQQGQLDGLQDMFNMSPSPAPLPYVAVSEPPSWTPPSGGACPKSGAGPSHRYRRSLYMKRPEARPLSGHSLIEKRS